MSYLGQGNQGLQSAIDPGLKDYTHASKTFLSNGYQYTPRLKFLFHVFFNINTANIPQLQAAYGSGAIATIGMMVKSADLPKFKIDTAVMNQYNRKRVVQTKMRYEPSRITFHDDQADLIRNMWYDYYQYYYGDPSHQYQGVSTLSGTMGNIMTLANGFNYNLSDIYSQTILSQDWGFQGETYHDGTNLLFSGLGGKPPFFRDITIYGLSEKKFAQWTLINPLITNWNGDTYDYSEGGSAMKNDMTFEYEAVKYYSGTVGNPQPSNTVTGFADPAHYDTTPSGITTPIAQASVYGQGGLINPGAGTVQDLTATTAGMGGLQNVLGAVQMAGVAYNTLANNSIVSQFAPGLQAALNGTGQGTLPGAVSGAIGSAGSAIAGAASGAYNAASGFFFPSAPTAAQATLDASGTVTSAADPTAWGGG